jgi:hypothetical protein
MTIRDFSFEDSHAGWKLERFDLGDLNLLVGLSGVGKTRTLNALRSVRDAAVGRPTMFYDCKWSLGVCAQGTNFRWEVETAPNPAANSAEAVFPDEPDDLAVDEMDDDERFTRFEKERILLDDGTDLVLRTPDDLHIGGSPLPPLKPTESVISLFRTDPRISPLFLSLVRFLKSRAGARDLQVPADRRNMGLKKVKAKSFEHLRNDTQLPLVAKAWLLQEMHPETFLRLVGEYRAIFSTVSEVKVGWLDDFRPTGGGESRYGFPIELLDIAIREEGIKGWVVSPQMSSGMRRTLVHLLELALSPTGTVILVDEYENSLGVNCLPALSDHLLQRSRALQFILTSHHPYVINNIHKDLWRVVTRQGSTVRIRPASDFPELATGSHQDAFLQLLQAIERESESP